MVYELSLMTHLDILNHWATEWTYEDNRAILSSVLIKMIDTKRK